ncbi:capsular polysaccharide biosynthesis protein CapF [Planococcus halotolerans]|uniref:capsular polysaccharide biosynthesis protein CapF n=1 Tax=Planococcus halotolerans TaxID=2233542 RepID=UPI00109199AE|nr:capsular polysaccharide biosynthesis protein CapF [Planococcus halotolerans]QHJ70644.1 NAD-dependent epimerase/dehydratase family protein [Planococcus halotolerans]
MKILVTGAEGFVGRNLAAELKNQGYEDLLLYTRKNTAADLERYAQECDFVFHLAGVNRPEKEEDFLKGNHDLISELLSFLKKHGNRSPVVVTSSIQAERDNPYGRSKKAGEDVVFEYGRQTGNDVFVYRLVNLFGKWSRPNYNSVVATFCHNIARDLEVQVNDRGAELQLCYIDDVLEEFKRALKGQPTRDGKFCRVPETHKITVSELADKIRLFKESRRNLELPDMKDPLTKKLYSTYLSYLPEDRFSYQLKVNSDDRGSFTEFLRTKGHGQISVNRSKPGITKGNHWHHTKNEKFLVVSGKGVIRLRKVDSDEVIEYFVDGKDMEVVDIPVGYTHNIENLGDTEMITIMWANELFDPEKPDTYYMGV